MIKKQASKSQILSKISDYHIFKKYAPRFNGEKLFYGDVNRTKREKQPSAY